MLLGRPLSPFFVLWNVWGGGVGGMGVGGGGGNEKRLTMRVTLTGSLVQEPAFARMENSILPPWWFVLIMLILLQCRPVPPSTSSASAGPQFPALAPGWEKSCRRTLL